VEIYDSNGYKTGPGLPGCRRLRRLKPFSIDEEGFLFGRL